MVVIGHDVWERRFGSDPAIVGQTVQLGDKHHAIVGVMPKGFAFPNNHSYWIPWHQDPLQYEQRSGPSVHVFGRLAPGATLESAQAELTAIGGRIAAANPKTHEHIRSRVKPYTFGYSDMDEMENYLMLQAIQTAVVLLLVIVCVNVGILVYARTATRQGEIAVRTALGASRRRVVGQLFIEALVLAALAAVVGIGSDGRGPEAGGCGHSPAGRPAAVLDGLRTQYPGSGVRRRAHLACGCDRRYRPGVEGHGGRVQSRLQGLSAGGGGRMQMGSLWTLLIVAQVAFTVALLPATMYHAWNSLQVPHRESRRRPGVPHRGTVARWHDGRRSRLRRRTRVRRSLCRPPGGTRAPAGSGVRGQQRDLLDGGSWQRAGVVLEAEGMAPPANRVDYNIVEGSKQGHLVRFNRIAPDLFSASTFPSFSAALSRRGYFE